MAAFANNANYPETPAYQSDPSYPSTGYCDDAYCFAALDFVRAQAQVYNPTGLTDEHGYERQEKILPSVGILHP
jgi:hypothetical protein